MLGFYISTVPTGYYFHLAHHVYRLTKHAVRVLLTTAAVTVLSFLVINIVLFCIQINSLPMFARVGDINLGLKTPAEAKVLLENYSQSQQLNLTIQDKTYRKSAMSVGISLKTDSILHSVQHPTGWNKIPLFNLLNNRRNTFAMQRSIDVKSLQSYLKTIEFPAKVEPTNAAVVIPEDLTKPAYISPEKDGYSFSVDELSAQLVNEASNQNLAIVAQPKILEPKIKTDQLNAALEQTNALLATKFSITNGAVSYQFSASDLRKIVIINIPEQGQPTALISQSQVIEILRAHSTLFYKAPQLAKVTTVDGNVVSSSGGSNGQAINIEESAKLIVKALQSGQSSQSLSMSNVSPATTYLRSYTATSAGLLALIKDFAATHSGTYKVVTFELSDNRSAYFNQDASIVPASTYKVFLAYVALKKVEEGSLSMSSQTSAGSLDFCIQKMIHVSDNTCAHAILDTVGWAETDKVIHAAGYGSTNLNNSGGGYMKTTANDVAALLKDLYNGALLNASDTGYLFDLMKNQIYRSGIPAGSPNSVVADKVGFLEVWNHDAAIVYAPNSTYILVIMTTNSSFSQIKDLANQIYNIYNQ